MKTLTIDEASSSAIIVKNAILARSGIYIYSHEEMLRRGHVPEVTKAFYREYRPASVLVAAKDKFKYAVLTKEHPQSITADNVQQVIEGVVGSNIEVVVLENDEIALKGELAFYTKDAVSYYDTGAKETSAQYISKVSAVTCDDYDYILEEIQEVQGLALTRQGRGGSSVAVLDSLISAGAKPEEKNIQGDKKMGKSILSFFGIGNPPQDELSSLVIDSLTGYIGVSDAEKKTRRDKVESLISSLADSKEKNILIDTVKDCFAYPKEVLEKKEEISKGLKSLYNLCAGSDVTALQATFDSIKSKDSDDEDEDDKKKKEDETKDAEEKKKKDDEEAEKKKSEGTKDSIVLDAAGLEKLITKVTDSLSAKIDETVKKHLGLEVKTETKDSILPSFSSEQKDNSFLLNDMFK
jgi:hypothetical protein